MAFRMLLALNEELRMRNHTTGQEYHRTQIARNKTIASN